MLEPRTSTVRTCACDELSRAAQQENTPAGCSKRPDFLPAHPSAVISPARPESAKTASSPWDAPCPKQGRSERPKMILPSLLVYVDYDGSNESPTACVECGPSNSLDLSLGEWSRLPFTARIERAQFHRARSASTKGTWPLPPMLADFFSILLELRRILACGCWPLKAKRGTHLARIIHERFCCNRGFAAATSLDAVGTASRQAGSPLGRSVNILFQVCLPPSWLRAPVSLGDCAISRRTVMNNAGYA
jgi:hypothetical protein